MKTVYKLSKKELEELRQAYFDQLLETDPEVLDGIENADEIDMLDVIEHYDGISFVDEDFFCNI